MPAKQRIALEKRGMIDHCSASRRAEPAGYIATGVL